MDHPVSQPLFTSTAADLYPFPPTPLAFDASWTDSTPAGAVQPKEEILREIMAECEEIERRSSPSSVSSAATSPTWWADDSDSGADSSIPSPSVSPSSSSPSAGGPLRTDRKEKKKLQNRVAATRYREKKRRERDATKAIHDELLAKNIALKEREAAIVMETKYLRRLMDEIGLRIGQKTQS